MISVTATISCFTDQTRTTPGQVGSFGITFSLFREDTGVPVGLPKEVRREAPSTGFMASASFPDPQSTGVQICLSGRHFAEVTGMVAFKSGSPTTGKGTVTTGAAFVTCESKGFDPLPPIQLPTGLTATGDDMQANETLPPDAFIRSADGRFRLHYQNDTNLVLHRDPEAVPLWATGLKPDGVGVTIMQSDGNLVVYNARGYPVWASGTAGNPNSRLVVQNDGNLVIYRADGAPIWASNTVQPRAGPVDGRSRS